MTRNVEFAQLLVIERICRWVLLPLADLRLRLRFDLHEACRR